MSLREMAASVAEAGRHGDEHLLHISDEELQRLLDTGLITRNPKTGAYEAFSFGGFLGNIFSNPVVDIGLALAGAEFLPELAGAAGAADVGAEATGAGFTLDAAGNLVPLVADTSSVEAAGASLGLTGAALAAFTAAGGGDAGIAAETAAGGAIAAPAAAAAAAPAATPGAPGVTPGVSPIGAGGAGVGGSRPAAGFGSTVPRSGRPGRFGRTLC